MRPIYCYFFILSFTVVSCVSTGTYKALQLDKQKSDSLYGWAMQTLKSSQGDNDRLNKEKSALRDSMNDAGLQLNAVKENNTTLRKQLDDLSAISSSQAESIRKSLDNIGAKDLYMQQLRSALSRRDSVNLAVLMELKAAMGSFGDSIVSIKVERGVVRLNVADAVLFGPDSVGYSVSEKGKTVLVRLARVLRDQPGVDCAVEEYMDSVAVAADSAMGGWGLKVRRSASVVRTLQTQYNILTARLTAVGKGGAGWGTGIVLMPQSGSLAEILEKR
jgi:chemotaxis protein MotB